MPPSLRRACAVLLLLPAGLAEAADPTPAQPRGPFYPAALPEERDADLTRVGERSARGEPLELSGRILERSGAPVAGARVEIWQTNAFGRYHHPRDRSPGQLDPGFQGWGEARSGPDGAYSFRTIRPQPYSGRTAHIHFAVTAPGRQVFYTQLYFADPANEQDGLYTALSPQEQARLTVEPGPRARFDVVLP